MHFLPEIEILKTESDREKEKKTTKMQPDKQQNEQQKSLKAKIKIDNKSFNTLKAFENIFLC